MECSEKLFNSLSTLYECEITFNKHKQKSAEHAFQYTRADHNKTGCAAVKTTLGEMGIPPRHLSVNNTAKETSALRCTGRSNRGGL